MKTDKLPSTSSQQERFDCFKHQMMKLEGQLPPPVLSHQVGWTFPGSTKIKTVLECSSILWRPNTERTTMGNTYQWIWITIWKT